MMKKTYLLSLINFCLFISYIDAQVLDESINKQNEPDVFSVIIDVKILAFRGDCHIDELQVLSEDTTDVLETITDITVLNAESSEDADGYPVCDMTVLFNLDTSFIGQNVFFQTRQLINLPPGQTMKMENNAPPIKLQNDDLYTIKSDIEASKIMMVPTWYYDYNKDRYNMLFLRHLHSKYRVDPILKELCKNEKCTIGITEMKLSLSSSKKGEYVILCGAYEKEKNKFILDQQVVDFFSGISEKEISFYLKN